MTYNVGSIDRYVRIVVGLALLAFPVRGAPLGPVEVAAATIGFILVVTAFFAYCPLYTLLGINTRHEPRSS